MTSKETVTIPRSKYEALLQRCEDLEDTLAAMEAHNGSYIPHEIVLDLLADTKPMLAYRRYRGMTLRELSETTGLGASYLSEIERGRKTGSLTALLRIAAALDTTIDILVGWETDEREGDEPMTGPHDVGGLPTDEPIDRGEHEWADWERQTAAVMGAVRSAGLMTVDEMRRGIEALPPDEYEALSYYERWAASMETILVEKGVISPDEVDGRVKSLEERWG